MFLFKDDREELELEKLCVRKTMAISSGAEIVSANDDNPCSEQYTSQLITEKFSLRNTKGK